MSSSHGCHCNNVVCAEVRVWHLSCWTRSTRSDQIFHVSVKHPWPWGRLCLYVIKNTLHQTRVTDWKFPMSSCWVLCEEHFRLCTEHWMPHVHACVSILILGCLPLPIWVIYGRHHLVRRAKQTQTPLKCACGHTSHTPVPVRSSKHQTAELGSLLQTSDCGIGICLPYGGSLHNDFERWICRKTALTWATLVARLNLLQ